MFSAPGAAPSFSFGAPQTQQQPQQQQQQPSFFPPATTTPAQGQAPAASPFQSSMFGNLGASTGVNFGATTSGGIFGTSTGASTAPLGNFLNPQQQQAPIQHENSELANARKELTDIERRYAPYLKYAPQDQILGQGGKNYKIVYLASAESGDVQHNIECEFDAILYGEKGSIREDDVRQMPTGSERWKKAQIENPDPENLVSRRITGIVELDTTFKDLKSNSDRLQEIVSKTKERVERLESNMSNHHGNYQKILLNHARLYNKLLSVMRQVEKLRCRHKPITRGEIQFRKRLELMLNQLGEPYSHLQYLVSKQAQQEQISYPSQSGVVSARGGGGR